MCLCSVDEDEDDDEEDEDEEVESLGGAENTRSLFASFEPLRKANLGVVVVVEPWWVSPYHRRREADCDRPKRARHQGVGQR